MIRQGAICGFLCALLSIGCEVAETESDRTFRKGMEHFRTASWREAEERFEQVLQAAPDSSVATARLGEIFLETNRREEARRVFERLPSDFLKRPEAMVLKSRILASDGRTAEALALSERALEQYPDDLDARLHLAHLHLLAGFTMDLERARTLNQEVLQREPREPRAALMLLKATLRMGDFDGVAEIGERLSTDYPRNSLIALLLGTAGMWREDPSAIVHLRRAVDLSLDYPIDRLQALWMLKLACEREGGYPAELPDRYRLYTASPAPYAGPLSFTDVANNAGVAKRDRGRGSAWLDCDGDGDPDLFSVGIQSAHALYRNGGGGRFEEVGAQVGLADDRGGWGATAVDFDNDGDLDLYVSRDAWEGRAPNSLYRNDSGLFTDIATSVGAADSSCSFTATWADFDIDGYADLYVANGILDDGEKNSLLMNRNGITFVNVADGAGVADPGKSLGTASGDYDADGLPDIYVVNIGQPNRLYHNEGSAYFEDRADEAGVIYPVEGGYVTAFLDYDNDGSLDLFAATMSGFGAVLKSMISEQLI